MITVKTEEDIALLREGGRRLAATLDALEDVIAPGVSTSALNALAEKLIRDGGDTPAFLNYHPHFASRAYPATLCVAVNDEVVHGIPTEEDKILKEGDIIGIDLGLVHKGRYTDSARTVPVGKVDAKALELIRVTKEALNKGMAVATNGAHVGDIGSAIEAYVKPHGFGIVKELCGHGVGYAPHEEPNIPNYGKRGTGPLLKAGMVVAIEPMLNEGSKKVKFSRNGYTVRTKDGKRSAHFEHTIVITHGAPEILTRSTRLK